MYLPEWTSQIVVANYLYYSMKVSVLCWCGNSYEYDLHRFKLYHVLYIYNYRV